MNIYVKLDSINSTIQKLKENNKFLVINKNVFSIDNIKTVLNITEKTELPFNYLGTSEFSFSYNDGCISDVINVIYEHEDYTTRKYIENCKLISDTEKNELWNKSWEIAKKKYENSCMFKEEYQSCLLTDKISDVDVDEIFYNELLVLISSKINQNDKENIVDDFSSKYLIYKEEKVALTEKTKDTLNEFYNLLVSNITE